MGAGRSGSTMTMDVFFKSLETAVYHQQDQRAFNNRRLRDLERIARLLARSRAAVAIFKPLHDNQHARRYLDIFPDLKIVWLLRDYRDSVNSGIRRWAHLKERLARVVSHPDDCGWWGESLSPESRALLHAHYHDDMSAASAQALFWCLRHRFFFEQSLETEARVRVFRYEQLVTDPRREFAAMFALCACPFQPEFTSDVHGASIGLHAPPRLDPEIEDLCRNLSASFDRLSTSQPPTNATRSLQPSAASG
jgi:hypothetical protein